MLGDLSNVLQQDEINLRVWLSEWYDFAFKVGLVRPPFKLDEASAGRLEGYFMGLSPAEGAVAFFGVMH